MLASTRGIWHQTDVSLASRPPGFPRVSYLCDSCHTGSELGHLRALKVHVQPVRRCASRFKIYDQVIPACLARLDWQDEAHIVLEGLASTLPLIRNAA